MAKHVYKKGNKKLGGRKKGTQNVVTKTVKDAFLYAFNELQKDPKKNLVSWGRRSPNAFYMLAAKLIPLEFKGEIKSTIVEKITGFEILPDEETSNKIKPETKTGT